MTKYIIKNCQHSLYNYNENDFMCLKDEHEKKYRCFCKDVSDCLLKQITDLCIERKERCQNCPRVYFLMDSCLSCPYNTNRLAEDICEKLEIEEVE